MPSPCPRPGIRTLAVTTLLVACSVVWLAGCATKPASATQAMNDVHLGKYTITVPADAIVYSTLRPERERPSGIVPTATWRSQTIYAHGVVVRMPDRRGTLVFYDPASAGGERAVSPPCFPPCSEPCRTCPREGFYNGMHATETLGQTSNGHYYKEVQYDRCGRASPAGLIGYYEDASASTRATFDAILRSVRR